MEPWEFPDEADSVMEFLGERELRLPAPDEWEQACGAGAETLFRWGSACLLDRAPYGDHDDPAGHRHRPNPRGSWAGRRQPLPPSIHAPAVTSTVRGSLWAVRAGQ
ncbi:hypothetical protein [Streptomyces niveus]|uniref:hypothetical protein n=1 Tax=Streptomyces niveus TaxID=193462 RepID=UPI0036467949